MKQFDYDSWNRKEIYEFFSSLSDPFYMVSFRQDVDDLYRYAKKNGLSFYYAMIWACTKAINETEAFHLTIRNGKPEYLEYRMPSFTDMKKGSEIFHIVSMDMADDIRAFCKEASEVSQAQEAFIDLSKETDELVYLTCLPWVDLTGLTNEMDRNASGFKDDSIPRIGWGMYKEENGRKVLTVSVEVNHRLIDGFHIGQFAKKLSEIIASLNEMWV